nr:PREDICTED: DNA-binding protein HEXBP-like [Linepithema humile]
MGELRVSGMDPSVTTDEIGRAVIEQGDCSPTEVKVGEIRRVGNSGTAWVRCPLRAAKKLAQVGHIKTAWFPIKVELLEARPLQCFKCLERGHVRAKCPNNVDRSDTCYRCGTAGHLAKDCTAQANCAVCKAAGRQASHRLGGPACKAPKSGGRRKGGKAASAPSPQSEKLPAGTATPPGASGPSPHVSMEVEPSPAAAGEESMEVGPQE